MSKPDQKKLRLLILLLIALGVTLFIGFRINRRPNPEVVQAQASKNEPIVPVQRDARIHLELLNKKNSEEAGKKNLFQYPQPKPVAPPPQTTAQAPPPTFVPPAVPVTPPLPPPPPPIPLKYIGVAYVEPNSKALIAALMDGQVHFNAVVGDVYLGRYRVARITETAVDIEDLQLNRRQTLPIVKQQ
jgi:hypothetical protein